MYSDLLLLVKKFYGSNLPMNRKRMCIRCKCSISFCFNAVSSRSTCSNVLVMYIRATWLKGNCSRGDNTNCINESFYCSYDTCTHAHTHAHTVNNGLAMGGGGGGGSRFTPTFTHAAAVSNHYSRSIMCNMYTIQFHSTTRQVSYNRRRGAQYNC